jgi:hypothetical protein
MTSSYLDETCSPELLVGHNINLEDKKPLRQRERRSIVVDELASRVQACS